MSDQYDYYMYTKPYHGLRCRIVEKPTRSFHTANYVVAVEPFGAKKPTGEETKVTCSRGQFKKTMPPLWKKRRKERGDV